MSQPREGLFWEMIDGRKPAPPAGVLLGFRLLEADPQQQRIRIEFQARPEFVNPIGNIQGGFLAAMLDDTLGPAVVQTLGPDQFAPTLELKVSFLKPAKPGVLIGEGRVLKKGRSIAFLSGELRDADGDIVASATATAMIVSR
jgi:uncharacterized protein (TIGR00369 family)